MIILGNILQLINEKGKFLIQITEFKYYHANIFRD